MTKHATTSQPVACTECGAADAIQIDLELPDGTQVLFCSCHRCENRWWNSGGKELALDAVLKLARKASK
ncbi:MAG: hypothetical protein OEM22_04740 [Acidimicrobiia bacterium]|nr:hypothetical protein [Acidimicrobiia bacterium]MDH3470266.1 hypothetical protein [Acidimicrobiia bacterium]